MRHILLATITLILITSCKSAFYKKNATGAEGWLDIVVTEDTEIYIDTLSITHKEALSYAKEKRVYTTPESRENYINKIRAKYTELKKPEKADKWLDFKYSIYLCEYDCLNKRFRTLWIEDFDSTGKLIARTPSSEKNIRWMNVDTETVGDYTFFFVCDYHK